MAHEVKRPVDAGVPGTEDAMLGYPGDRIPRGVGVAHEQKLNPLGAIVQNKFVIEKQVGNAKGAFRDILSGIGALGGIGKFLGVSLHLFGAKAMANNGGTLGGPHRVAPSVIAMVVRIKDIADRFFGCLFDFGDNIPGLFGEVGVDHHDIVLENDPGVVASAKREQRVGGRDLGKPEKDPGGDLTHFAVLHGGFEASRGGINRLTERGTKAEQN